MQFREFLEKEEKTESIMGVAKAGWNALAGTARTGAGIMTVGDEILAGLMGDGTKGRMRTGVDQIRRGTSQILSRTVPDPDAKWFYSRKGREFGPVASKEIMGLVASGRLGRDDLIWRKGQEKRRAGDSKKLFPHEDPKEKEMDRAEKAMDVVVSGRSARESRWSELSRQLKSARNQSERAAIMTKMAETDFDRYLKTYKAAKSGRKR